MINYVYHNATIQLQQYLINQYIILITSQHMYINQPSLKRVYTALQLDSSLKISTNTMVILLIDNDLQIDSLIQFGNSLCQTDCKPQQQQQEKSKKIKQRCCQQLDYHYFYNQSQNSQIIFADISWLDTDNFNNDMQKVTKYCDKLFCLNLINTVLKSIREDSKVRVYLALGEKKKSENTKLNLQKYYNILGSKIFGTIYCNYRKDKVETTDLNQIYLSEFGEALNQENVTLQNILQYPKKNFFDHVFKFNYLKQSLKDELLRNFQKKKSEAQLIIQSFLNPIEKLMVTIFLQKSYTTNNIFEVVNPILKKYQKSSQKIKQTISTKTQRVSFTQQIQIKSPIKNYKKYPKIKDNKIICLTFVLNFIKISQNLSKHEDQAITNTYKFFKESFQALKLIDDKYQKQCQTISQIVNLLLQQTHILTNLSITQNKQYLNQNILDKTGIYLPKIPELLANILQLQISQDAQLSYYQQLLELISCQTTPQDYDKISQFQLQSYKKKKLQMKLKLLKSKRTITLYLHTTNQPNNNQNNNCKIAQAIQQQLSVYKQYKQLQLKFQVLLASTFQNIKQQPQQQQLNIILILKNVAYYLRLLHQPKLSLQIYKKLKFIYQLEQCIKQIIHYQQEQTPKLSLYLQTSEYYRCIQEFQLSKKYLQYAYQLNPTIQIVNKLIMNKKEIIERKTNNYQMKEDLVENYDQADIESYCYGQLSGKFWEEIGKLKETVGQEIKNQELAVQVSAKQIKGVFRLMGVTRK